MKDVSVHRSASTVDIKTATRASKGAQMISKMKMKPRATIAKNRLKKESSGLQTLLKPLVIASMQLTVPCDPSLAQRANNSELAAHLGSQKSKLRQME
jgi:hypothetical protein